MGIRLYDSAWVELEGQTFPLQVRKDRTYPSIFHVGDFQYDIDGRPSAKTPNAPKIEKLHDLASAREAGLTTRYDRDID